MPNKTLYVGPRQEATWRLAEATAAANNLSLSGFVMRALREYLDRPRPEDGAMPAVGLAERVAALEDAVEGITGRRTDPNGAERSVPFGAVPPG